MPSWGSRLLSSLPSTPNNQSPASASQLRHDSPVAESSLSSSPIGPGHGQSQGQGQGQGHGHWGLHHSSHHPTRTASGHARSASQPFPSFLTGRRKTIKEQYTGIEDGLGNGLFLDSGDEEPRTGRERAASHSKAMSAEKELVTGHCLTCDSLVRWPKDIKVFRCTICLMVNDLVPQSARTQTDGLQGTTTGSGGLGRSGIARKAPVLSVKTTKGLIDRCMSSYLDHRLRVKAMKDKGKDAGRSPSQDIPESDTPEMSKPDIQSPSKPSPVVHVASLMSTPRRRHESRDEDPVLPASAPQQNIWPADARARADALMTPQTARKPLPVTPDENPLLEARRDYLGSHSPNSPGNLEHRRPDEHTPLRVREPTLFKTVEDYIVSCFKSWECINSAFPLARIVTAPRPASEDPPKTETLSPETAENPVLSLVDAKTLLAGDFAENGAWWTGIASRPRRPSDSRRRERSNERLAAGKPYVSSRSPNIDYDELDEWYSTLASAGSDWRLGLEQKEAAKEPNTEESSPIILTEERIEGLVGSIRDVEEYIAEARSHLERTLLKAVEAILKRPDHPLKKPEDTRAFMVILANPRLLHSPLPTSQPTRAQSLRARNLSITRSPSKRLESAHAQSPGLNAGITKRIVGLISNLPKECHHYLVSWLCRFPEDRFRALVEFIGRFVTYRLTRQHTRKPSANVNITADLIPTLTTDSASQLHAALSLGGGGSLSAGGTPSKRQSNSNSSMAYSDDWQVKAGARMMALLFSANCYGNLRSVDRILSSGQNTSVATSFMDSRSSAHNRGLILPTSSFYNTMLDYFDLVADFDEWESRRGKFSFCQYPFFLSIWSKIHIMEYDARRQMEIKAREAFFNSLMSKKPVSQFLVLRVRRECLVEDSLRGVSEVVGAGQEEIKKGLRIEFVGEEGIDAGGLRKEWFLLLVREVFDPNHGMFEYDEDSQYCYFSPNSFETSDQFFLVGVLLGLAIYNSTILDVAFPPFAFKKLLAAAPSSSATPRQPMSFSLEDLAEYKPALARGLQEMLDFEGDVQETFCRDFVADVDRYGQIVQVPLCPDGERRPVTNANRKEFVDLYIRYLLESAVSKQFEPFKRGFYTVCGGNALSLFRPEEIELLIRGSDEALDISSLRAVAQYENWGSTNPDESEPVIGWFWEFFTRSLPIDQRKILSFITGSDRIPAMGATTLTIKIVSLGNDSERYPVARTCFNALYLYRYSTQEKLELRLWRAVMESEGFGLK